MASGDQENEIQISTKDITIDREDVLGRGGYGHVFTAYMADGKKVAVKMLIDEGFLPKRNLRELKREAQRLRELSHHPSIIDLNGVLMEKDHYGLVLEYMHFGSAFEFVNTIKVDISLLLRMTCQVASAVMYLHSYNPPILHLDLKADNVLVDKKFDAKVGDFGLSQWKTVTANVTQGETKANRRCTLTHIAPEVLKDINHKSTEKLDIYAFGVTTWELFAGKRPFHQMSEDMIRQAVLDKQRPDFQNLQANTPDIIKLMIQKCWHNDPEARPAFKDIFPQMEKTFKDHQDRLNEAFKSVRQQICEIYNVNDPQFIDTEYIDDMEIDETDSVPMETEMANYQNVNESTNNEKMEEQGIPISPVLKQSPPLVYTPRNQNLSQDDNQLRNILRNPLAFEMIQSGMNDVVPISDEMLEIVRDPVRLRDYINNDPELRNELLRSGSPLLSRISAPSVRDKKVQGKQEQWLNQSLNKLITPQHMKGNVNMEELSADEQRRLKHARAMTNCSYMDRLTNNGLGLKLLKVLKEEPIKLQQALEQKRASEVDGVPRFETIDKSVMEAAQDPVLLQILLTQDYNILDYLMRFHPNLMLKLISANKTHYKNPTPKPLHASGTSNSASRGKGHDGMHERAQRMGMGTMKGSQEHQTGDRRTLGTGNRTFDRKNTAEGQRDRNQTKQDELEKIMEKARRRKLEEDRRKREVEEQRKKAREHQTEMKSRVKMEHSPSRAPGGFLGPVYGLSRSCHGEALFGATANRMPMREQPSSLQLMDDFSMEEDEVWGESKSGRGKSTPPVRSHGEPLAPRPDNHATNPPSPTLRGQPPTSNTPKGSQPERNGTTSSSPNQDSEGGTPKQTPPMGGAPGVGGVIGHAGGNITISYAHGGGAFSHITMNADAKIPPNIQVGNKNVMVINDNSDSDGASESVKKTSKKQRHREIKLPDQPLNMDRLDVVCTNIGKDWKKLCRELGLEEAQIEQIHQDFHINGTYEVMYQALQRWMQKKGKAATIKALGQHLSNINRFDITKQLK